MTEADLRHDSTHLKSVKRTLEISEGGCNYISVSSDFLCAEEARRTVFRISAEFNYVFLSPKNNNYGPRTGSRFGVQKEGPRFVNTRIFVARDRDKIPD